VESGSPLENASEKMARIPIEIGERTFGVATGLRRPFRVVRHLVIQAGVATPPD
jgi:hypothetical protein